jgi:hypothetical protein
MEEAPIARPHDDSSKAQDKLAEIIAQIKSMRRERFQDWDYLDAWEVDAILDNQKVDLEATIRQAMSRGSELPFILASILEDADDTPNRPLATYLRMARALEHHLVSITEGSGEIETYKTLDAQVLWHSPQEDTKPRISHEVRIKGHGVTNAIREFNRMIDEGALPEQALDTMRWAGWNVYTVEMLPQHEVDTMSEDGWKARLYET